MKKILCAILAIILFLSGFSSYAADEIIVSGSLNCPAGSSITWSYNQSSKTITFSGSGVAFGINPGQTPYNDYISEIETAIFESGITEIWSGALCNAEKLSLVNIPDTVSKIGGNSFYQCNSLEQINIPGIIKEIGDRAFYSCDKLKNIYINRESRFDIGQEAFYGDSSLRDSNGKLTIPYGAVSIGIKAYNNAMSVRCFEIPETVTSIKSLAFRNCISLEGVIIPSSVENICEDSFRLADGVTNKDATIICKKNSVAYDYALSQKMEYNFIDNNINAKEWIYEGFEDVSFSNVTASNCTIARVFTNTPDNSRGALNIVNENLGYISSNINMRTGNTYKVSAWVKAVSSNCVATIKILASDTSGENNLICATNDGGVKLTQNTWQLVEFSFYCDGTGFDVNNEIKSAEDAKKIIFSVNDTEYYVDNFSVIPIQSHISCESLVNGNSVEFSIATDTKYDCFYYEIVKNDDVVVKSGTTKESIITYNPVLDDNGDTLTFNCSGIYVDGNVGASASCVTQTIQNGVDNETTYPNEGLTHHIISENFDDGNKNFINAFGSPTISYSTQERNGENTKVMNVTVNTKYDSPRIWFYPVKGTNYEVTAWVKQSSGKEIINPELFIEGVKKSDYSYLYQIITDKETVVTNDEWTKIKFIYKYDAKLTKVGTDGTKFDCLDSVRLSFRLGNEAGFSYLIDDIKITPQVPIAEARFEGDTLTDNTIKLDILSNYETDGFIYFAKCGENVLGYGFSDEGIVEIPITQDLVNKSIAADFSPVIGGVIGEKKSVTSSKIQFEKDFGKAEFYNSFLDGNTISGKITYNNFDRTKIPQKFLAFYKEGKLIKVREAYSDSFEETIDDADSANILVWNKDNLSPLIEKSQINNTSQNIRIYVDSVNGSDENSGTVISPLKTIKAAKDYVRSILKTATDDIYVMLKSGEYQIDSTLEFDTDDYSEDINVIYKSYGEGQAYISGAKHINDWSIYEPEKNIYRAYVGTNVKTRQMYVNGIRAQRARSEIKLIGLENGTYDEIGHTTTDTSFLAYQYPKDLEMVYFVAWTNPRCLVDSIYEENGKVRIKMNEIGWKNLNNKQNATLAPKVPSYYENAYELLDEDGEWYLNTHDGYLYYKPRAFEDMTKNVDVVLPIVEKLVTVTGQESTFVKNITFENIGFKYATWLRPSTDIGHSDSQSNKIRDGIKVMYHDDGTYEIIYDKTNDYIPDAAVEVYWAKNVNFKNCEFSKLGSVGLKMVYGIKELSIAGNKFYDISGNGLCIGEPYIDYNTTDDNRIMRNINISNNIVYDIGVDFKSASGLAITFAQDSIINNNEIFRTPYSGIHIGHCPNSYTKNLKIQNNYVHDVLNQYLSDGGGIYHSNGTQGTQEDPNIISGNYVRDVMNNAWRIAFDNGSNGYLVYNNVTEAIRPKVMNDIAAAWAGNWDIYDISSGNYDISCYDNYGTLGSQPLSTNITNHHVYKYGQWDEKPLDIINNAGLQTDYIYKFSDIIREVNIEDSYDLYAGEYVIPQISVLTDKENEFKANYNVYLVSDNENIAKINGDKIEAVANGTANVTVYVLNNETVIKNTVKITVL